MAIYDHKYAPGSGADVSLDGRRGSAELWVYSDSANDTGHAVTEYLIDEGFVYGMVYAVGDDTNSKLRLERIGKPEYVAGSCWVWRVSLEFKTLEPADPNNNNGEIGSPTDVRAKFKISSVTRREAIEEGIYRGGLDHVALGWELDKKRLITTSAGLPHVPAIEIDWHNKVLTIIRTFAAIDFSDENFPERWINDADIILSNGVTRVPIPQFGCKFLGWSTNEIKNDESDLVEITFTGEVKKEGWRLNLLDKSSMADACNKPDGRGGTYQTADFKAGQPSKRNILDPAGTPVSEPVGLDGRGNPLPGCTDEAHYGIWSGYDEIDMSAIGFFAGLVITESEEPSGD